jgi:hypothetical protein
MDRDLPDSMSVWWPEATIAECVKRYVELWDIDAVGVACNESDLGTMHLMTSSLILFKKHNNAFVLHNTQIITFDHHGVSGHANHRAIATTLRYINNPVLGSAHCVQS